jgi:hypothetical protein
MTRISAYTFSLFLLFPVISLRGQDSISVPLKISAGFDILGPTGYFTNNDNLILEGYISFDHNTKRSFTFEAGYQDSKYSQYNYTYLSKGMFFRGGIDFNLIDPFLAAGKYYAGIGLRYGISFYTTEVPSFSYNDNYWSEVSSFIAATNHVAHFVEINPGIRTEIFRNVSIGWNVRLKFLIHSGTGKNLKPVIVPGFGNGTKTFNPGMNYYLIISIPYRKVFVKPAPEKVTEPETEPVKVRQ